MHRGGIIFFACHKSKTICPLVKHKSIKLQASREKHTNLKSFTNFEPSPEACSLGPGANKESRSGLEERPSIIIITRKPIAKKLLKHSNVEFFFNRVVAIAEFDCRVAEVPDIPTAIHFLERRISCSEIDG